MERRKILMLIYIVFVFLACLGMGTKESPDKIINNKAPVLDITSCSTYDLGCERLANLNNKDSVVKRNAFKVEEDVFAISVDNYMVSIVYNKKENKLEYVGISEVKGLEEIKRNSYTIFNPFVPSYLKEDKAVTNDLSEDISNENSEDLIIIDGVEKTKEQWEQLEENLQSNKEGKGASSESIKEHEALMKYQEQINNEGNVKEVGEINNEVIIK